MRQSARIPLKLRPPAAFIQCGTIHSCETSTGPRHDGITRAKERCVVRVVECDGRDAPRIVPFEEDSIHFEDPHRITIRQQQGLVESVSKDERPIHFTR